MNDLTGERIGFVVTGSFCTFSAAFAEAAKLRAAGPLCDTVKALCGCVGAGFCHPETEGEGDSDLLVPVRKADFN